MARRLKTKGPEATDNVVYEKELHHTCSNSAICKIKVNPDKECKDCVHYRLLEVDIIPEPKRDEIDWGF